MRSIVCGPVSRRLSVEIREIFHREIREIREIRIDEIFTGRSGSSGSNQQGISDLPVIRRPPFSLRVMFTRRSGRFRGDEIFTGRSGSSGEEPKGSPISPISL